MTWNGAELDWLIILGFGGLALWALLVRPVTRWRFERFAREAVWTKARVVGTHTKTIARFGQSTHRDPVRFHYADLQFTTEDGSVCDVRRRVAKGVGQGAEIPVAYHSDHPAGARLDWARTAASRAGGGVTGFVVYAGIGFVFLWGIGAIEFG